MDKRRISESTPLLSVQYSNRDYCEKVPRNCVVGIDVKSVSKEFEDGGQIVTALHETDIKILEGEITVILGKHLFASGLFKDLLNSRIKQTQNLLIVFLTYIFLFLLNFSSKTLMIVLSCSKLSLSRQDLTGRESPLC